MKAKRFNATETMMTNLDTIDTDKKVPLQVKVCNMIRSSFLFCKQGAPHPSPQESYWSDIDWDGTQAKA